MADSKAVSHHRTKDIPPTNSQQQQITYLQKIPNNTGDLGNSSSNTPVVHYKPSKAFLERCVTTQQALLEQIKSDYHRDLRNLYQNELNADVLVQIGENFTKPLHGCILASRVFRFYNTLKLFKSSSHKSIAQESHDNDQLFHSYLSKQSTTKENDSYNLDPINNNKQIYAIPLELISPDLFKNFVRRIYLDEDVREEELRLTAKFGDWLKVNRPNLVKNINIPQRYSPNHRATFRTIIPDFKEQSFIDRPSMAMSIEPDSIESSATNIKMDPLDKNANENLSSDGQHSSGAKLHTGVDVTMIHQRSDSLSGPSSGNLPRTETFEKISSNMGELNLDAQTNYADKTDTIIAQDGDEIDSKIRSSVGKNDAANLMSSSNINAHPNSSQEDDRSDYGADISSADGSNAPTPTSNAQLSFSSTPKDIKLTTKPSPASSAHVIPKQRTSTTTTIAYQKSLTIQNASRPSTLINNDASIRNRVTSTSSSSASSPANKAIHPINTGKSSEQQPVAQKRSTCNSASNKSLMSSTRTAASSTPKATQQHPTNPIVARAKPISLERAQSPTLMGNKSRPSHIKASNAGKTTGFHDRRATSTPQQAGYDSETLGSEISDSGSFILESSTAPGGYFSIDRYTLASISKLAEAMTRMYLEEVEADVTINVNGSKQIRAHKCILATRSAYLAEAIEKQNHINARNNSIDDSSSPKQSIDEDAEKEEHQFIKQTHNNLNDTQQTYINLTDYSYSVVRFALLHLYSGIVKVPDDLELEELAKLTYQLHVGTLRQVCQHNLRMTYCHFFHKPCNICTLGVLKTLPLAWRYDYSDLYAKCLQWIGTNFASIFCLKEFADLRPTDLIEECYTATLNQLQPDNIIQRTLECQKLLKNLPKVKWTESIIGLVGRQLEDFCHYVANNYDKILQTESFMNLGKNCWECEILEENLLAAMNHLKPDMGCKCLVLLHKLECSNETFDDEAANRFSDSFANLICKMRKYCERYLIREAAQVVHCSSWKQMNPSLQRKIKDQALITVDFEDPTRHLSNKPKLTSSISKQNSHSPQAITSQNSGHNSSSEDSNKPSSISKPSSGPGAQLPPMKNKKIISRHVKVLK